MDTKQEIGLLDLKAIKYKLRDTFETIKEDPMNLNLLMEHIAELTGSVVVMSEYLTDLEQRREEVTG